MAFDPNNVPLSYLMQPELLSAKDIFDILVARCIRVDNMEQMDRDQLLNLFDRVVMPKQQRTNTRRCSAPSQVHNQHNHGNLHANKKFKKCDTMDKVSNDTSQQHGVCENNQMQMNGIVHHQCDKVPLKRSFNGQTNNDEPKAKKTRQKICWP